MTADLTPAQAARLDEVERVARALWNAVITKWDVEDWDEQGEELQAEYRRLAVAAIDVMRGATDDGAVGRVLRLADSLDQNGVDCRVGERKRIYHFAAKRIRAAVGVPATAEGDGG